MNTITAWAMAVLTGVLTAEQTATSETPGASKLKTATDIAASELGLASQLLPSQGKLLQLGSNLAVAALNFFGVFTHKSPKPATPAGN